tara:strand:+ start:732 stop:1538 length:807 start_codon:yes stop_codon:yes gene_type:complete
MKMFCITINQDHYEKIKKIGYLPVCLGKKKLDYNFISDNNGESISEKNPFYGEYTFHYWIWKNEIKNLEDNWIGFCQYRKYWVDKKAHENINGLTNLNEVVLKEIPSKLSSYESILGEPIFINQFKPLKFLKKNFTQMIKKPSLFFNKNERNIRFHFDLMHGKGNLDKAIEYLDIKERADFRKFVNTEVSFNPHNMFMCRSTKILNSYYSSVFPWLKKCEKEFGFNLNGYGLKRIYGFLAERYMSFWFKKYTNFTTLPIIFKDISELN